MIRENERPWGRYDVLRTAIDHQVKTITVLPNKRLSLQAHKRRSEHWVVVRGKAVATLDGQEIPVRGELVLTRRPGARQGRRSAFPK